MKSIKYRGREVYLDPETPSEDKRKTRFEKRVVFALGAFVILGALYAVKVSCDSYDATQVINSEREEGIEKLVE